MNFIQELEKLRSFLMGVVMSTKDETFIEILDFVIEDVNRLIVDMRSQDKESNDN